MNFNNHKAQAYLKYYSIEKDAYRDRVRFYEENFPAIEHLDYSEKIEIDIDYCLCLFELGRYARVLQRIDQLIETIISENIYEYMGMNIFNELLFRKAACYYNLQKIEACKNVLKQLIKIEPKNKVANSLYALCLRNSQSDLNIALGALTNVSILMAISITIVIILLIDPFYDEYVLPFYWIRNGCLVVALLNIIFGEILLNYRIFKQTGRFSSFFLNNIYDKYFQK